MKKISIGQPVFMGNEKRYVLECLASTQLSSRGEFVGRLEAQLAAYAGTRQAVACTNGTAALHLALLALGLKPGDEVIVPACTYIATASAVTYCGAIPVFADVEASTGNICCKSVESLITERTKGIVVVHLYGQPARMDELTALAKERDIFVIEDAAQAIGSTLNGRQVGSIGHAGIFSLHGSKAIACGEGGAVVTNDGALAETMKLLRNHGAVEDRHYFHRVIGFNYRMPNLLAAVALAQLENADLHTEARRRAAEFYSKNLKPLEDLLQLPQIEESSTTSFWTYPVRLRPGLGVMRDDLIKAMQLDGIETRPTFNALHKMPPFQKDASASIHLPQSEAWAQDGLCLPTHAGLSDEDLQFIVDHLAHHGRDPRYARRIF